MFSLRFLLMSLGMLLVVACGQAATVSTPVPSPTSMPAPSQGATPDQNAPSAQEVFESSVEAMRQTSSFHYEMNANLTPNGDEPSGGIPLMLVGDYQSPDRMRGALEVAFGDFSFTMDLVTIGDTSYVTNPRTGEWQQSELPVAALPSPEKLSDISQEKVGRLEMVGVETLDGSQVYHLRGPAPENIMGAPEKGELAADYWVSVDDFLMREIKASGEVSLEGSPIAPPGGGDIPESAALDVTIGFSRYGEPVNIEAPQTP